ncbi:hypothetical protein ACTPEF_27130, partial [Clostridioides difficile]
MFGVSTYKAIHFANVLSDILDAVLITFAEDGDGLIHARLPFDEQKQLQNNLKLAKKLGGEIIVLHGENIIEQILRIAK